MKNHQLNKCAALCLTFLSALTLVGGVHAQDQHSIAPSSEQNQSAMIEIHGQKGQTGPECLYMNLATLPVKSASGALVVKGGLNGRATMMVIDTGTLHTKLTLQEAEKLGLKLNHSKITETDADGERSATYATFIDDISLDKFFWHRVKLGVVSNIPKSYSALAGADILLNGLHKDVEFSLAAGQMKIFVPSGCEHAFLAYWDNNASTVPLMDLAPEDTRQIVTVSVNGHEMIALIDSGAPTSTINLEAAARVGITPQSAGVTEATSGVELGRHHGKGWLASFDSFTIGSETIKNPTIGIADLWGPIPPDSALAAGAALRLLSIAPTRAVDPGRGGSGVADSPSARMAELGSMRTEAITGVRPDMLLGADFLRSHHVLLAISQQRLYYTYLGGKVFGNDGKPSVAADVHAELDLGGERYSLNP